MALDGAYSGNALNQSLFSGARQEPVTVNKANPTLQTTPNPRAARGWRRRWVTPPICRVAISRPGDHVPAVSAVGSELHADAERSSTRWLSNGNGIYSTSLNYQKALVNQVGTWHWKAIYSGDANNNAVTSPCAAEPVMITQPTLSIAKTPDSATIIEGATATFTIVADQSRAWGGEGRDDQRLRCRRVAG